MPISAEQSLEHFSMPRGPILTDVEMGTILALDSTGATHSSIVDALGRHRTTVQRFLARPQRRQQKKFKARNKKLTGAEHRLLIREASKTGKTALVLKNRLNLNISVRRIQEILHDTSYLQYNKMQRAPLLTKLHRSARMEFARQQLEWNGKKWLRVLFSDEKKFNLDGPDGLACYWHDIRKHPRFFNTRQQGGASLMVRGAISYYGASRLVQIVGNQDSVMYCQTLQHGLLPFAADILGENWTFQQDNASIHRSQYTKKWLKDKNVDFIAWPSRSPDLNIIENVWGLLARKVFPSGKQYQDLETLAAAVGKAWLEIDEDYLEKLYQSLPRRLIQVLDRRGACTDY